VAPASTCPWTEDHSTWSTSGPALPDDGDDDLLRSAARWDVRAARLGKPHEFSPCDGAWIGAGEGARDETRCDCVMDAFR
jgi:hypothetical protein